VSVPPPSLRVRRDADRARTRTPWLDSRHSFSFGAHYDPADTHHGLLLAHNEEVVAPGPGFAEHPHRHTEIVTWVLSGALHHEDSAGHAGVVTPGLAQRMSAGSGIRHAERADGAGPVRFVQMWVVPDEPDGEPGYAQRDVTPDLRGGGLVPVVSGRSGDAAVRIAQRGATLHAARLEPGRSVALPDAPYLHLFVARGAVALEGAGPLAEGDAARCTAVGGQRVTATAPAEILVWEMHADLAR
jgi:quercetin 2,3-dioxygenase